MSNVEKDLKQLYRTAQIVLTVLGALIVVARALR
jgi:hypothetical protein